MKVGRMLMGPIILLQLLLSVFLVFVAEFLYNGVLYILLEAPDQLRVKREEQLSIYVRQWSPSKYELGAIAEIIVDEDSSNDLIKKVFRT